MEQYLFVLIHLQGIQLAHRSMSTYQVVHNMGNILFLILILEAQENIDYSYWVSFGEGLFIIVLAGVQTWYIMRLLDSKRLLM